ncbi:MAG: hypothetical protein PVF91_04475 [Chromatiales bacterium]|jgi:hypothetical protein
MLSRKYLALPLTAVLAAAPLTVEAEPDNPAMTYLDQGTYEGVPYLSGGIGLVERRYITSALEPGYNLKLEFAEANGDYLADIGVRIVDDNGDTVLEVESAGPWLLTRLGPGKYTVEATADGRTITKRVTVGRGSPRVVFKDW